MSAISLAAISTRLAGASRELKLFAIASLAMGVAYSVIDSTFNNFLNERFALTGFQRSFLEVPARAARPAGGVYLRPACGSCAAAGWGRWRWSLGWRAPC